METAPNLLFGEKPYVVVVRYRSFIDRDICWSCLKMGAGKLLICTRCKLAAYCSKECQLHDWNTQQHKRECMVFRKASEEDRRMLHGP